MVRHGVTWMGKIKENKVNVLPTLVDMAVTIMQQMLLNFLGVFLCSSISALLAESWVLALYRRQCGPKRPPEGLNLQDQRSLLT